MLTSGNVSDEPIAYRDDDALERLGDHRRRFLLHDRPIHTRTDDSVARRRRRAPGRCCAAHAGTCPRHGACPSPAESLLLACGAELKSTPCLAKGSRAWLGHHIGDLGTPRPSGVHAGHRAAAAAVRRRPEVVAHDLHPDYLSTRTRSMRRRRADRPSSTTPPTLPPAWLSTASAARRSAPSSTARASAPTGRSGVASCSSATCAASSARGTLAGAAAGRRPRGRAAVADGLRVADRRGDGVLPPPLAGPVEERWRAVAEMARTGIASPVTTSAGACSTRWPRCAGCASRYVRGPGGDRARGVARAARARRSTRCRSAPLDARRSRRPLADVAAAPAGSSPRASTLTGRRATAAACAVAAKRAELDVVALGRRVPEPRLLGRPPPHCAPPGCACSSWSVCRPTTAASPTGRPRSPPAAAGPRRSGSRSRRCSLRARPAELGPRHASDPDHLTAPSSLDPHRGRALRPGPARLGEHGLGNSQRVARAPDGAAHAMVDTDPARAADASRARDPAP